MPPSSARPFVIVGAGALGCAIATRLQASGFSVRLAARAGSAPTELTRFCRLLDLDGVELAQAEVPVLAPDAAIPADAIVLVAVKAYDLRAALTELAPRLQSGQLGVLLTNGLGLAEEFQKLLHKQRADLASMAWLRGLCYFGVRRESAENLRFSGDAPFILAGESVADAESLAQFFRQVGFAQATRVPLSIAEAEWTKALLNLAINGICARELIQNGHILSTPDLRIEAQALVSECLQVALIRGVDLGGQEAAWESVERGIRATHANRCSTLQDVESGRPTEIPWLNGRIVDWAGQVGVWVPRNAEIAGIFG